MENLEQQADMDGCTYCPFYGSQGFSGQCQSCSNLRHSGFSVWSDDYNEQTDSKQKDASSDT